jgi:hypothetical protein
VYSFDAELQKLCTVTGLITASHSPSSGLYNAEGVKFCGNN